jgi:hypothetical protein
VLASFFKLSPLERSKSSGASSGVFDISSAVWSIVSPIPDYGVARTGSAQLQFMHIVDCLKNHQSW